MLERDAKFGHRPRNSSTPGDNEVLLRRQICTCGGNAPQLRRSEGLITRLTQARQRARRTAPLAALARLYELREPTDAIAFCRKDDEPLPYGKVERG